MLVASATVQARFMSVDVPTSLKALATVTETSPTSAACAVAMVLLKALATVTEMSSTLAAFVVVTAALALVRMSLDEHEDEYGAILHRLCVF